MGAPWVACNWEYLALNRFNDPDSLGRRAALNERLKHEVPIGVTHELVQLAFNLFQDAVNLFFGGSLQEPLNFSASVVVCSQAEHSPFDQFIGDHLIKKLPLVWGAQTYGLRMWDRAC